MAPASAIHAHAQQSVQRLNLHSELIRTLSLPEPLVQAHGGLARGRGQFDDGVLVTGQCGEGLQQLQHRGGFTGTRPAGNHRQAAGQGLQCRNGLPIDGSWIVTKLIRHKLPQYWWLGQRHGLITTD